jgi:hypothetical protein
LGETAPGRYSRQGRTLKEEFMSATCYQIRVHGHLRPEWSEWFEGMAIEHLANGDTLLTGQVADPPAIFGLLNRVRDLGLCMVSVNPVASYTAGES